MRTLIVIAAAVAAFTLTAPLANASTSPQQRREMHDRSVIRFFLHHPNLSRTPAGLAALWRVLDDQQTRLRSLQSARSLPATGDWLTAVRTIQRIYTGSEDWLLRCSASEGGHGPWVPNRQGSGAGGWMQYMEGTFWGDFHAALADARAHHFYVPASAASWYSPLGQALAGGWAYYHDRPAGKWTGGGCW